MIKTVLLSLSLVVLVSCQSTRIENDNPQKIKALIVDGQNNHQVWPLGTQLMKRYLEESGVFEVDVYRSQYTWKGGELLKQYPLADGKAYQELAKPKSDPDFSPEFTNYDVVISNFGWRAADWPEATQKSFEAYMRNGGGLVTVHAADNSFPKWLEFNKMIGVGGWGGRSEKDGPYVYFNENDKLIRDHSQGSAGGHGKQHEFQIKTRALQHPIMQGLPAIWMQSKDELYNHLRGPAENLTVLATAYDDPQFNGKGRNEPVLMTIDYHQGRIFHSTLGHGREALESVGFIATFLRGTQWAATGTVTLPVPDNFPSESKSMRNKTVLK